jgi:hypothetical protein
MDPQGEAPQRVQSVLQVAPDPVEEGGSPGWVGVDQPAGMLQVDREPDQVLLGTVVQLSLDAAPVGIGSEHEPPPRRSQLVDLGAQAVAQLLQCLDPRILQRDRLLLDYAELSVIVQAASRMIVATMQPTRMIMIDSMMEVSAVMVASTSSS